MVLEVGSFGDEKHGGNRQRTFVSVSVRERVRDRDREDLLPLYNKFPDQEMPPVCKGVNIQEEQALVSVYEAMVNLRQLSKEIHNPDEKCGRMPTIS